MKNLLIGKYAYKMGTAGRVMAPICLGKIVDTTTSGKYNKYHLVVLNGFKLELYCFTEVLIKDTPPAKL